MCWGNRDNWIEMDKSISIWVSPYPYLERHYPWMSHGFGTVTPVLGPIRKTRLGGMEEYLIPDRLLDIMAEVFYLIHGLYIVVINNSK